MSFEELNKYLNTIQEKLDLPADVSVPSMIIDKLSELTNLLGLSAECYGWAEKFYNEKIGELVLDKNYKNMTATDKKMLFASLASKEICTLTQADRLNSGIVHAIDGLRSMLSFLKAEYIEQHR